jgi:hypothetical protein
VVTESDPAVDVPGMATVILDAVGRLVYLGVVPDQSMANSPTVDWSALFADAGLNQGDFAQVEPAWKPLIHHDSQAVWENQPVETRPRIRVTAASLGGRAVLFSVTTADEASLASPSWSSSGRTRAGDSFLSALIFAVFLGSGVLARRNLRLGQGDRRRAWRLTTFFVCGSVLWEVLRAHHVPLALDEWEFLFDAIGWALMWGGLAWLMYIGVEPQVRRRRPTILISWTRLLVGHVYDPLVGRDVLAGLVAGILAVGLVALRSALSGSGDLELRYAFHVLDSLRSVRHCTAVLVFVVLDAMNFAVGGLLLLLLIDLVVRNRWVGASLWTALVMPLGMTGRLPLEWELIFGVLISILSLTVLLRLGLLSLVVMLLVTRLLTYAPITLDFKAWYLESSFIPLAVLVALSIYGFVVATAYRSSVHKLSVSNL